MKKSFLVLLLTATSFFATAQDKKALQERAQQVIDHTIAGNYNALMDLTYPKVFTIVPRETMLKALPEAMKGEGFSVKMIKAPANFKFGEIKTIEGGAYSVIDHDTHMAMIFDEAMDKEESDMMTASLKEAMEGGTVTYDAPTKTFNIKKRSQMVAVADKSSENKWTFISNQGGPMLGMLFSERVQKELGLKKITGLLLI